MAARPPSVLQIGCGSFGPTHLEAWRRLGLRGSLWVADPEARAVAAAGDIPPAWIVADYREVLREVDAVVDIVAGTDRHVELCLAALAAGKDVFVEKPLTRVADDARRLADAVEHTGRVLQVGYYFPPPSAHLVCAGADRPRRTRRAALSLGQLLGLQARAQGGRPHRQRRRALPRFVQLAARRRTGRGVRRPARPLRPRSRGPVADPAHLRERRWPRSRPATSSPAASPTTSSPTPSPPRRSRYAGAKTRSRSTIRPSASSGIGCATNSIRTASGGRPSGTRLCPSSIRAARSRCS